MNDETILVVGNYDIEKSKKYEGGVGAGRKCEQNYFILVHDTKLISSCLRITVLFSALMLKKRRQCRTHSAMM